MSPSKFFNLRTLLLTTLLLQTAHSEDATSSVAQQSAPFVDQITGLTMERFFGARTQFGFGIALPETPSSSFIGQLTFPLVNGAGWGAFGLSGDMDGIFAMAVWPDGKGGVMASFRQATDEDNPPEVTGAFSVRPLAGGVAVNNTFLTYTFLCENCLDATLGLGPEGTAGNAVMGWALSERALRDPGNPATFLGFHERGFGPFTARLGNAKTAQFEAVAATAGTAVPASGGATAAVPNVFSSGAGSDDEGDGGDGGQGVGRQGGGGGGGDGGDGGDAAGAGNDSDSDDD